MEDQWRIEGEIMEDQWKIDKAAQVVRAARTVRGKVVEVDIWVSVRMSTYRQAR